jgi:amino acid transporter
MDGITTGMAFLTGLGLPEILLWVLTFAVVFAVLTKAKIFSRAPSALVSIVVGFLVLMAVPAALITVIAGMSTGLVALAIGILVFISLIEIAGAKWIVQTEKGPQVAGSWHQGHSTAMAVIVLVLAAIVFWLSGGAALIGFGALPVIGMGSWLLVIVGVAVLWMLSESK